MYSSFEDSSRALKRKLSTMEADATTLIAITHCPLARWLEIAKRISRMRPGTHIHRLSYDVDARLGIIKCIPRQGHEVLMRLLEYAIMNLIVLYAVPTGSRIFTNAGNPQKEADASLAPSANE